MKPMSSLLVSFNSIEKPRYQTAGADKCGVAYTVLHKKKGVLSVISRTALQRGWMANVCKFPARLIPPNNQYKLVRLGFFPLKNLQSAL